MFFLITRFLTISEILSQISEGTGCSSEGGTGTVSEPPDIGFDFRAASLLINAEVTGRLGLNETGTILVSVLVSLRSRLSVSPSDSTDFNSFSILSRFFSFPDFLIDWINRSRMVFKNLKRFEIKSFRELRYSRPFGESMKVGSCACASMSL